MKLNYKDGLEKRINAEKQGDVAAMYIAKKRYAVSYEDREKYLFEII